MNRTCQAFLVLIILVELVHHTVAFSSLHLRHSRRHAVGPPWHDGTVPSLRSRRMVLSGTADPPAAAVPLHVSCTGSTFSKQSCLFTNNICLEQNSKQNTLTAWLKGTHSSEDHVQLIQRHLDRVFKDNYTAVHVYRASATDDESRRSIDAASSNVNSSRHSRITTSSTASNQQWNAAGFETEQATTMLWRSFNVDNQGSFGHALVNEALPIFLVLQNHFGQQIPHDLQMLATPQMEHALLHLVKGTLTQHVQLFKQRLNAVPAGKRGICFRQLLVGDGGYVRASRASLANGYVYEKYPVISYLTDRHAAQFAREPSFFSSSNWWNFRQHTMQMNGIADATTSSEQPLIVLNDKRYGRKSKLDRRMIIDVDGVAANISAAFPNAEVEAVRFRDLSWHDQLRVLSRAKVFITTQGSSAFRLVFLPKGAVCIVVGAPEPTGSAVWKSFHELDRWFPLAYAQFVRYEVSINDKDEYNVTGPAAWPLMWQPPWTEPLNRRAWWLYNADIRLNMDRLMPMLHSILLESKR